MNMKDVRIMEKRVNHLLEIYIARHCFGSAEALNMAPEVKRRLPAVRVEVKVLDDMTPAGTSIFATPSYYLDGGLIFLGNPRVDELVTRVRSAYPAEGGGAEDE